MLWRIHENQEVNDLISKFWSGQPIEASELDRAIEEVSQGLGLLVFLQ